MATYKCPNGHGSFTPKVDADYKPMKCGFCGATYVQAGGVA